MTQRHRRRWVNTAAALAALALLAAVFAAYLDPHRMLELAGRVWACF